MASKCSDLSLGTLCFDPGFLGYVHGSNKIHDWGIPALPATCGQCLQQAEYARNSPVLRREFMHMVLLSMFDQAGGYRKDYAYFDAFQQRWQQSDPQQILYAATASKYSPDLQPLKDWCVTAYPALAHVLWKSPTIRRLSCCESALDTLD